MIDYKGKKLTCTTDELNQFIASIEHSSSIHNFTEKYNNVTIENKTGNSNAVYIVVTIGGSKILQPFMPNANGYSPILAENAQTVIDGIVNGYIDQQVFSKYQEKPKTTEQEIAELKQSTAELTMLVATLAGASAVTTDTPTPAAK